MSLSRVFLLSPPLVYDVDCPVVSEVMRKTQIQPARVAVRVHGCGKPQPDRAPLRVTVLLQ